MHILYTHIQSCTLNTFCISTVTLSIRNCPATRGHLTESPRTKTAELHGVQTKEGRDEKSNYFFFFFYALHYIVTLFQRPHLLSTMSMTRVTTSPCLRCCLQPIVLMTNSTEKHHYLLSALLQWVY